MKNEISVIVITRNSEAFISNALESILNQTISILEILVIDGHSTDGTRQICETYPQVSFHLQRGEGIPNAYNQGIAISKGDLLAFNSSDDLWAPEKLEWQLKAFEESKDLQIVVGKAIHFLDKDLLEAPAGFRVSLLEESRNAYIMETLLAKREVFEQVGEFDESLHVSEDTDWYSRVFDLGISHHCVAHTIVRKRVHNRNSTLVKDGTKDLLSSLRASILRKRSGQ